jgi:multicomponent Na+:H+ antiporter subunit A
VGLSTALIFLIHGAPDVAMTQILIEVLLLIFFIINLYRLPSLVEINYLGRRQQFSAVLIAVLVGLVIALGMLTIIHTPLPSYVSHYYLQNSLPKAYGSNVVNVILVDFRAIDTLGEILVIAAAAFGIFSLIQAHGGKNLIPKLKQPSLILFFSSSAILQIMGIYSIYMLWRGHNKPGGGFIGGLIAACAITLFYLAQSNTSKSVAFFRHWSSLLVGGIILVISPVIIGLFAGVPPLTGLWFDFNFLDTSIKLGTPFLFDLGIYAIIIGAVVLMVRSLEK